MRKFDGTIAVLGSALNAVLLSTGRRLPSLSRKVSSLFESGAMWVVGNLAFIKQVVCVTPINLVLELQVPTSSDQI